MQETDYCTIAPAETVIIPNACGIVYATAMGSDSCKNKIALVTGSSRGIGAAIARKFALAGADIVLNYRKAGGSSQAQAEKLSDEIIAMGRQVLLAQVNEHAADARLIAQPAGEA